MTVRFNIMIKSNMTDSEFLELAGKTFDRLSVELEELDPDLDILEEGHILSIESEDGVRLILNIQEAMHQIWLAGPLGGFRYDADDNGVWRNTRTQAALKDDVLAALGVK